MGDIACRLGRPLMPWQQEVVDVAFELDPDGSFHYDQVVLTVPRQSGKTALILAFMVHRLTKMSRKLGRQRCTYTAQLRAKARLKLERDFSDVLRDGAGSFREVDAVRVKPTKPNEWRLSLNNGAENIQFGRGNYLQIDAPSRTGGHGDTLDLGVIDEAFAHYDDTIEAGMSPSMITRASKQIVVLSTAGDAKSVYLWRKVTAGRKACETGNHGRTAYFEWSVPDDADPGDPETWRACSPALGFTITERALEGEWEKAQRDGQHGIDQFRRAFLNQWPDIPVLDDAEDPGFHVIAADDWAACLQPQATPADTELAWALDCSPDGRSAAIATSDGTYVEVVDHRDGTSWAPPRLLELHQRHGFTLRLDKTGPAGALLSTLDELGVPWEPVTLQEHAQACGQLLTATTDRTLIHRGQPPLTAAARDAERRTVSDVWLWTRAKSSGDISPLVASGLARWAASQASGDVNIW